MMKKQVWNSFGILLGVNRVPGYLIIINNTGDIRLMSLTRYRGAVEKVEIEAMNLIGKEVEVQTSQRTAGWSSDEWFSGIRERF